MVLQIHAEIDFRKALDLSWYNNLKLGREGGRWQTEIYGVDKFNRFPKEVCMLLLFAILCEV